VPWCGNVAESCAWFQWEHPAGAGSSKARVAAEGSPASIRAQEFGGKVDPRKSGRSDSVCDEVIDRYSDYLDGLLAPHDAAQVQWHLSACASCGRYDRVMRQATELARELPEIVPSDDFAERLQHRIYHVQDGGAIASQRSAGVAATFAVASVIALLAWSPVFFDSDDGRVVQATSERAYPAPSTGPVLPAAPLMGEDLWFPLPPAQPLSSSDLIATLASFPGPYSPLVVMPPVHRGTVRTISTDYTTID
jgi:hypothetical protein